MKHSAIVAASLVLAAACPGQVSYIYDDGMSEASLGPSTPLTPADFMWGNVFLTQPGGAVISEISVAFGTVAPGTPCKVYLFSDTTPDGDPRDASLVASVTGLSGASGGSTYTTFAIPPTPVGPAFYAAVSMFFDRPGDRPAAQDLGNSALRNNSWVFAGPTLATTPNLATAPYSLNLSVLPAQFYGVFLVRARGGAGQPTCYPNCDGSTIPPVLNALDFSCFLTRYAAGEAYANCDGSTIPPALNALDFSCFLARFAQGCP